MGKKSQMELLGMAIVIVFISMGLLFIVRFSVLKEPEQTKKKYMHSELATNMLSALIQTDSAGECHNVKVRDLLIDCAERGTIDCYGQSSCIYVRSVIHDIFTETLGKMKVGYYFNASIRSATVASKGTKCTGERKTGLFFFNTDVGNLFVRLDICG